MGGGLWPTNGGGDKFTEIMRGYTNMSSAAPSSQASAPTGATTSSIIPVYITQAAQDTGFKLDVLSIFIAEILFAALVIVVKIILNKLEDR
jgi:hypothetical protein